MSQIIKLTRGYTTLVDDDMFDMLNKFKWHVSGPDNCLYATRKQHIKGSNGKYKRIFMHKEIVKTNIQVDHINGDRLDNRRSNLRECIHAENMRNRRINKNSTTGFRGVSRIILPSGKVKFKAVVNCNKIYFYLGLFETPEEAAKAYAKVAKKLYGEFYVATNGA